MNARRNAFLLSGVCWNWGGGPHQFLQPTELLRKSGNRQVPEAWQPPIGHIDHLIEKLVKRKLVTCTYWHTCFVSLCTWIHFSLKSVKLRGLLQSVQVHIQNSKQPPLLALSSPHSSPTSLSSRSPRDTALTSTGRTLQLASTNIHFPNAKVNGVHGEWVLHVVSRLGEWWRVRVPTSSANTFHSTKTGGVQDQWGVHQISGLRLLVT